MIARGRIRTTRQVRRQSATSVIVLALLAVTAVPAGLCAGGISGHDYDPDNAEEIMELCAGCHGEFGQGGGGGEYPRLAGLPARYLAAQMRAFKNKERANMAMAPYATDREMPEQDLLDISVFLSRLELPSRIPVIDPELDSLEKLLITRRVFNVPRLDGDLDRGRAAYDAKCKRCHGVAGAGRGKNPPLAGQYSEYLKAQIASFRADLRPASRMKKAAMDVSDADLEAILAFLSTVDD